MTDAGSGAGSTGDEDGDSDEGEEGGDGDDAGGIPEAPAEFSMQRYLAAKRSIDDRSLDRRVLSTLRTAVDARADRHGGPFSVLEVGAGVGTMVDRAVEWDLLPAGPVRYAAVDVDADSLTVAADRLADDPPEGYDARRPAAGTDDAASDSDDGNDASPAPEDRPDRDHTVDQDAGAGVADDATAAVAALATPAGSEGPTLRDRVVLDGPDRRVVVDLVAGDALAVARGVGNADAGAGVDLLVGMALLDLFERGAVEDLVAAVAPGGLCYFPITFDGGTAFEPPTGLAPDGDPTVGDPGAGSGDRIDDLDAGDDPDTGDGDSGVGGDLDDDGVGVAADGSVGADGAADRLDDRLLARFHASMAADGDPRAGRHAAVDLPAAGVDLLAVGASDWVVRPVDGTYPADEAYFLHHVLGLLGGTLADDERLDDGTVRAWRRERHRQVDRGQLHYFAHQFDLLGRVPGEEGGREAGAGVGVGSAGLGPGPDAGTGDG